MLSQKADRLRGKQGPPVLSSLPLPHHDLPALKIDVLDLKALHEPEAGAVHQHDGQKV